MNFINTKTLPHFSQPEKGFWMVSSNHFCFLFINFQMSFKPTFRLKPSLLDLECTWDRFSPLGIERLVLAGGHQADDYSSYLYAFDYSSYLYAFDYSSYLYAFDYSSYLYAFDYSSYLYAFDYSSYLYAFDYSSYLYAFEASKKCFCRQVCEPSSVSTS